MNMLRPKHTITICTLAIAPLLAVGAYAATYYVATTGNDSNPGTEKQPWRTMAYAANTMVAGDTTYVKSGAYHEGLIRFRKSGTSSAPIRLANAPGESPVIHCIDPPGIHRIELRAPQTSGSVGWIIVEGFEIRNCWEAAKIYNAHDVTFRQNWMHDNHNQGFLGNGTRVLLDRNIINHNGPFATNPGGTRAHGIYGNGTAWTITNNLIYDNLGYNIQLNGSPTSFYDPAKHASPEFAVSANWIIANNTFAYSKNRAAIVLWGSTCNHTRIENNIFHENAVARPTGAAQGVDFASTTCTGIRIRNNLSYATGTGGQRFIASGATEGVHYTQSGNIVNSGDPQFVNAPADLPTSPKFALTEGSPAIDNGLTLTTIKIDFNGTTRPQGRAYDIGAYEYKAGSDDQSPSAPRALRIN